MLAIVVSAQLDHNPDVWWGLMWDSSAFRFRRLHRQKKADADEHVHCNSWVGSYYLQREHADGRSWFILCDFWNKGES